MLFFIACLAKQPISLVESIPSEVDAHSSDITDTSTAWQSMFDRATTTIDLASFYISPSESIDALDPIWASLKRATQRGVQLRVLVDLSFSDKYPAPLKELETWPNTTLKRVDYTPGVMHAKYFIIDNKEAFLGSQNFDYRALEHIFELGVHIKDPHISQSMRNIFNLDWGNSTQYQTSQPNSDVFLVASPPTALPKEVPHDLPSILSLINSSQQTLRLQFLSYNNKTRAKESWTVLDDALIRAQKRGVQVELMVSDWATKGSKGASLEKLRQHGIRVHVASVPEHSSGFIPFARTVHAKYIVADEKHCWIGTSNASKGYFDTSRNIGLIIHNKHECSQMSDFFARILRIQQP